jgi:hypothetical protein
MFCLGAAENSKIVFFSVARSLETSHKLCDIGKKILGSKKWIFLISDSPI